MDDDGIRLALQTEGRDQLVHAGHAPFLRAMAGQGRPGGEVDGLSQRLDANHRVLLFDVGRYLPDCGLAGDLSVQHDPPPNVILHQRCPVS